MRSVSWRLCLIAAALSAGVAAPMIARAQLAASATVESEYRIRGVALSDGEPDLRLGLSYDHPSGAYAGATLIGGETGSDGSHLLGYVAYAGFAVRSESGLIWDIGTTTSQINLYLPIYPAAYSVQPLGYGGIEARNASTASTFHYRADYSELYGGLSWRATSVHLYISPEYLGQTMRTAYLDVTETVRPMTHVRLFAHVGALTPLAGSAGPGSTRERYDLGAGAVWELHHGEVQLAWSGISPQVQYPIGYPQPRSAVILSVTGFL
ncbi:MAG: TorF family putative porin [Steroidobacteraceae bacterium]